VGWFWYLGTMLPMIGLVQVGNQAMADRYAYLPFVGLLVIMVWGAAEWMAGHKSSTKYLAAASLAALATFCVATRIQLSYWRDDFSLWAHTLAVTNDNFVAENNLGVTLIKQGRREEAVAHFGTASEIEPGDGTSQLNLGIYAQEHGDLSQAAIRYQVVLTLAVDSQIRAGAYANLGSIYFARRDYARARENLEAAMNLKRVFPGALLQLGLIAQKSEDWNRAAGYYAQLAEVAPSDVAYLLLAQAFERSGRVQDAEMAYRQAERLSRDMNQARQTVGKLLEE
jgi:tetratricopeptide (TPR) repeat protein